MYGSMGVWECGRKKQILPYPHTPIPKRVIIFLEWPYTRYAHCYLTKPLDLDPFIRVVGAIEDFWLTIVKLLRA